jgi:S-adenosylmethionine-dependent methyltransferase
MDAQDIAAAFDRGAREWAGYHHTPLGRIRHEVTWHNLASWLPTIADAAHPPCVLDAGGGSGEMAIQLVQHGYRVCLLDSAPGMVELARAAAEALPAAMSARLTCHTADVAQAGQEFGAASFEVILCHTMIEYVPEPVTALEQLVNLLRGGGVLSVSFVNRHAEVFRRVWQEADPAGALAALDRAAFHAALFRLDGVAFAGEDVETWLSRLGLRVTARCGVRVFADNVAREHLDHPGFFGDLLRLEKAVSDRPPYPSLARYSQLIAHKSVVDSPAA